jgi:hypothetical protein
VAHAQDPSMPCVQERVAKNVPMMILRAAAAGDAELVSAYMLLFLSCFVAMMTRPADGASVSKHGC